MASRYSHNPTINFYFNLFNMLLGKLEPQLGNETVVLKAELCVALIARTSVALIVWAAFDSIMCHPATEAVFETEVAHDNHQLKMGMHRERTHVRFTAQFFRLRSQLGVLPEHFRPPLVS